MAVIKFSNNGSTWTEVATPVSVQWAEMDLDSDKSGRETTSGLMFRDVIAKKRQIQVTWEKLTMAEVQTIINAVANPFFFLYFPDAKQGAYATMECYVSDRSTPAWVLYEDGEGVLEWIWDSLQLQFTER